MSINIVNYSEKAIAVLGETKPLKDHLSAIGGKWNPSLTHNGEKVPGWIFVISKRDEVKKILLAYSQGSLGDAPVKEKKEYWIDECNNLHCKIEYSISYIMDKSINKERIQVNFGENKSLYFNPWELNIIQTQTIHWKKEGISIPALELNDVTKKADILLYIYLSNT